MSENSKQTAKVTVNATVSSREDLRGLSVLRITPDSPRVFIAGQHVEARFTSDERRFYSIASAPFDPFIEIYATYDANDLAWPKIGDRVYIGEPSGSLVLARAPANAPVVFLATGTGIAPFASMVRAGLGSRQAVLIHGVRTENDLGYRALFEQTLGSDYIPIVSRDAAFPGRKGHVQHVLAAQDGVLGQPLLTETTHVFLCGSRQMVLEIEALLAGKGFSAGHNLHYEGA